MNLKAYRNKRNFRKTTEPTGRTSDKSADFLYVIQKHAASHLHYDFRLALQGVLKSWAVPKGPCLDPTVKRLAIQVEDHPLAYGSFEGTIPQGEYGGGAVQLWDNGSWHPLDANPQKALDKGHLRMELHGRKLQGRWDLIRFHNKSAKKEWFLVKYRDDFARKATDYDVTAEQPLSVVSQLSVEAIGEGQSAKKIAHKTATFPREIGIQLATLVDQPPTGDDWLHEVKFDGYRILALKNRKKVTLLSRNHLDWTDKFPDIAKAIAQLPVDKAILDGEIVILDKEGRSSFQALQNAIGNPDSPFIYYVFDLLYLDKYDLRNRPLLERKALLQPLVQQDLLRYSDHIIGQGETVFKQSCHAGLEGIISKEMNSLYTGKRDHSWLKTKCVKRQELVIGGFTAPKGQRPWFGSLLLGFFDASKQFVYCGKVGTGFSENTLKMLYQKMQKIVTNTCPFTQKPPLTATFVQPKIIVEVKFTEWTEDNHLRHAVYQGLRMDKKARQVKREEPVLPTITHGEKILYPEDNLSKQAIYDYYMHISDWILPWITNRLLTLVRCPSGYHKCFYQKHFNGLSSSALQRFAVKNSHGETENYLYLEDKIGLASLVQSGVLEIHPWGSTIAELEYPDMIIFDLDPGPEVPWKMVVEAAFLVKEQLEKLQLQPFVKTTGGKGLHVVSPIVPEHSWDIVKHYTHVFAQYMEKSWPELFVSNMAKSKRKHKIFIDYLRNQKNATAIAPYSTRARIHAPVATPLHWSELTDNQEDTFYTIQTMVKRLDHLKDDPWKNFSQSRRSLQFDR